MQAKGREYGSDSSGNLQACEKVPPWVGGFMGDTNPTDHGPIDSWEITNNKKQLSFGVVCYTVKAKWLQNNWASTTIDTCTQVGRCILHRKLFKNVQANWYQHFSRTIYGCFKLIGSQVF